MEQLHEHNQKTYENICRMYDEGIQRVAVVQPTRSGKSLLMAKLIEDNSDSRFFVLSTSHKINDQFKAKLNEAMLERVDFNIYCNMPNMKQEVMEALQPDYIFLDEMHRALAKEWSKGIKVLLEMYPNAKVLGLSATPIRYLDKCRNVVEELFCGNLACDMSLSEAILDGILPMARYVCGVYSYQKDAESLNKKIEKSCNSEKEKKELLKELKVLKENLDKGNGVSDIFRKYVSGNEKFVVFLKDTTHLRVMKPVIEKWFIDAGFNVRMYEVHCKNVERDKEFKAFKEDTEGGIVKLCLSVNMIAEGIHGDVSGVIMLRETISPNMYFQMIGRAFSCGKKTIPLIFDLVANSQFISDAADNFPNELKREIEKRKKECEKEGKDYEVGFDVDEFIVMDYFMDVVSGFKAIEGRLQGSWDLYIKALEQFKERTGNSLVPAKHIEVLDGLNVSLGRWVQSMRTVKRSLCIEKINQLEDMGFIWNENRYKFERNVISCIDFYNVHKRKPSEYSKEKYERKIGMFWSSNSNPSKLLQLSQWKIELLKQIPNFFDEKECRFDKFYRMALIYKERYGHVNIKSNDVIDDYKIGQIYFDLVKDYKNKRSEIEQIKKLNKIGIDITTSKNKCEFNRKMQLAKQAVNEGVVLSRSNQKYKGINLYTWKQSHIKDFSNEEMKIMNKLVHSLKTPINIKDIELDNTYTFLSIKEAAKALRSEFHVVDSDKKGIGIIHGRLTGKIKNPIYKGRFRFEYVGDETI